MFVMLAILSAEAMCSDKKEGPEQTRPVAAVRLGHRLLGTLSADSITQSWAYIEELAPERQCRWYKLQERLTDGSRIVEIRRVEVVLVKNGKQEILILEGPVSKGETVSISPTQRITNEYAALISAKAAKAGKPGLTGLKKGDVIVSANGQRLSTPQKAIQVLRKLHNFSQIRLQLLRNKQLLKLNYELKD